MVNACQTRVASCRSSCFDKIAGPSQAGKASLDSVGKVAPTEFTVGMTCGFGSYLSGS